MMAALLDGVLVSRCEQPWRHYSDTLATSGRWDFFQSWWDYPRAENWVGHWAGPMGALLAVHWVGDWAGPKAGQLVCSWAAYWAVRLAACSAAQMA